MCTHKSDYYYIRTSVMQCIVWMYSTWCRMSVGLSKFEYTLFVICDRDTNVMDTLMDGKIYRKVAEHSGGMRS